MTPKPGCKITDKPKPGEDLNHFIKRLRKKDPLCLQDDAVMRSKRFAQWKVNEGNDGDVEDDI